MNYKPNNHLDILAFGAHPDDVEAGASGLLIKAKNQGLTTGIIDLTAGEMGTTGNKEIRSQEANKASQILKLDFRESLGLPDAGIVNSSENQQKIIHVIRRHTPQIILIPYWEDRHPDHMITSHMVSHCIFYSELGKLTTKHPLHKPQLVLYYMLHFQFEPSFILDISQEFSTKMEVLTSHHSQYKKEGEIPDHPEEEPHEHLEFFENRARFYGSSIGTKFGEPYKAKQVLGLKDINNIIPNNFS